MTYIEVLWVCIYPWILIGLVPSILGLNMVKHNLRVPGYILALGSIYCFYLGAQQGVTKLLQVVTSPTPATVALIETMPIVYSAVSLIGFIVLSRGDSPDEEGGDEGIKDG